MPIFQPNVPTGTIPLKQDYLNLQGNNQQLNIAYGVDHVPLTDTSGVPPGGISGMHTVIHMTSQPGTAAIPGIGALFTKTFTDVSGTDTQLFYKTGLGVLNQLTGGQAIQNGYQYISLSTLQWGVATKKTGQTVSFNFNFTTTSFIVLCTVLQNDNNRHNVQVKTATNAGFVVACRDSSGQDETVTFSWLAIGD